MQKAAGSVISGFMTLSSRFIHTVDKSKNVFLFLPNAIVDERFFHSKIDGKETSITFFSKETNRKFFEWKSLSGLEKVSMQTRVEFMSE
jgi:hypothetical protein